MTASLVVAALLALGLLGYLGFALLKPEKFQ
ncbi:MAG: K(+)-transporting ATPase subunit F [Geothrix sp.]|jgi:K+-transporting ATPase KdpF subunit|nr:K(+)-transporting ATPase subunit F [Holophagaceae bacterium]MBK8789660.1 K(+)-transporting ATPase subunit F [Holophagaceae bacterium]MBP7619082.1 K(+)-transporting ATPase subunit F [Geothrix sp.]MCC6513354.1 K(+)-transporting ATPase subunit F [Geothrix sp.]